jgi:hypothetical protein
MTANNDFKDDVDNDNTHKLTKKLDTDMALRLRLNILDDHLFFA